MKQIETQVKIFRAAIECFVNKGKHGAKMQEIADKAQINKAMLFYYFENKEKLYGYVFETVLLRIFGSLHELFKTEVAFSISLRLFIDRYIDLVDSNPQIPLFVLRELSGSNNTAHEVLIRLKNESKLIFPQYFLDAAEQAVIKGEIKKTDPAQLLFTVIGSATYFFLSEPLIKPFLEAENYDRKKFLISFKTHIFETIYSGIKK